MQSKAKTVKEYLASLPEDRRRLVSKVRDAVRKNLPKGYEEGMQYGMIGWYVPHEVYPDGYHCDPRQPVPFASVAAQKNHVSLYLMCTYAIEEERAWLADAWRASGKKLDMGKGCIRFKKLEDVPLDVVGQAVKRVPVKAFLEHYEAVVKPGGKRRKSAAAKKAARKPTAKKAPARKAPAKAAAAKKKKAARRA